MFGSLFLLIMPNRETQPVSIAFPLAD